MRTDSNDDLSVRVFKLRGLILILSVTFLIWCLCGFLGALMIRQESVIKGVLFLVGTMAPFTFLGAVFLIGKSKICISQKGISRRFLCGDLQAMKWNDVEIIKVFPMGRGPRGRNLTGINIISTQPHRGILSRKIWLAEEIDDINELIEVLNRYIGKYQIPVERTVGGVTTRSSYI